MLAVFFVWFAAVVGSFTKFLIISGIVGLACMAAWTFFHMLGNMDRPGEGKQPYPLSKTAPRRIAYLAAFFLFLGSIMPEEKTVYLMGAAYVGQTVVQSDTADRVKRILDGKLDQYLGEFETKAKNVQIPDVKAVAKDAAKAAAEKAVEKATEGAK